MQSSGTFIRRSGFIPEVKKKKKKKICIDYWLGKYYCILERIQAKQGAGEQVRFFLNAVLGLGVEYSQSNFAIFTLI